MASYIPTIGLEIHAELKTKTKMFCDSLNDPQESHPNVNICPICMGHPGTLPVPNKTAIEHVLRVGFALNSQIAQYSKFDRKNYFYPDLPKGYQISQYDMPFCTGGFIEVEIRGSAKKVDIERIHLEEDTARLLHTKDNKNSLVDFNRAGVPLMELVTKPVIENGKQARKFAEELQLILRYLGASDADMEKGQMRVEVNISLAKNGAKELGTKVELKNLNSLRAAEESIEYEINRQGKLLDKGDQVTQETRGWDENKKETFSQRIKETSSDYRYFPEPDIPPLELVPQKGFSLGELHVSLPELPQAKRARFIKQYKHTPETAEVFVAEREFADYFEAVVSEMMSWEKVAKHNDKDKGNLILLAANYIVKNLRTLLTETSMPVAELKITPENFGEFIYLIHQGEISSAAAREVISAMFATGRDPSDIIEQKGLKQVSDTGELEKIADKVIRDNPEPAVQYKEGKENALQFLVGAVMRESKGKANPQVAAELLKKRLK